MIVGIRVEALNPKTGNVNHTNSCYFTMAAKDELGNLKVVPGLILRNREQVRRFYEGKLIKEFSKEKRDLLKADFEDVDFSELIEVCLSQKCEINLD
jgi:acyl-CoA hydrolase